MSGIHLSKAAGTIGTGYPEVNSRETHYRNHVATLTQNARLSRAGAGPKMEFSVIPDT
jgi:hypothetical protein